MPRYLTSQRKQASAMRNSQRCVPTWMRSARVLLGKKRRSFRDFNTAPRSQASMSILGSGKRLLNDNDHFSITSTTSMTTSLNTRVFHPDEHIGGTHL